MNTRRLMLVVFLACLALGSFRFEWTYGIPEGSFFMRVAVAVVPVAVVLISGLAVGAFRLRGNARRWWFALMGGAIFGTIVAVHALVPHEFTASLRPDFYLSLTLTIAGAMIGYWFAADLRDLQWGLKSIAFFLALLSVYAGLMRLIGARELSPLLVPGWPVRLFILFAYCWYLHEWLNRSRWSIGPLLGLVACSPEVFMTFHKPTLFCAVVASAFLFFYSLWATRRVTAIVARTAVLALIGVSMLLAANLFASGQLFERINREVAQRMLHEGARKRNETLGEAVERMAGNRFYLWREGLARFQTSPLIGVGFGQQIVGRESHLEQGAGMGERYAVYVHSGYLDLLVSVGILGSLPIGIALIWWLRLTLSRDLAKYRGHLVVPCLAFVFAIFAYNLGGGSRVFFSLNAFLVFFMAVIVRLADGLPAATPLAIPRYGAVGSLSPRRRIRYVGGRS